MTKGFLIHAHNNSQIDYINLALCSALLIKKNLKTNNIALITDTESYQLLENKFDKTLINKAFDKTIFIEKDYKVGNRTFYDTRYSNKTLPYYNTSRTNSFHLSPWDQTILIDADYLVLDSMLDNVWDSTEDFLINSRVKNIADIQNKDPSITRLNESNIPLYWATVVYFQKTKFVESIFNLTSFIKENYEYYSKVYMLPTSSYYRNDFAISIALHMINKHVENNDIHSLPNNIIYTADEHDDMINFKNGSAYFISEKEQGQFRLHQFMTNIHVMNKLSIGRMAERIINYASS